MTQAPTPGPLSGDNWLTIDTAPKDGSRFESQDRTNYKRRIFTNTYWYVHPAVQGFVTEEIDCTDYEFEPTHWRPSRLAPTAPVEASGSGWEQVRAEIEKAFAEGITSEEILSWFRPQPSGETRSDFTSVTGLWKVQTLSRLERVRAHRFEFGSELKAALEAVDEESARQSLIRPAPVASGGQHSSGPDEPTEEMIQAALKVDLGAEDERWTVINLWQTMKAAAPAAETAGEAVAADSQPLGDVLTSEDLEALITDARTPKWVNGDYTPTEAMVEAGLEYNHRHASEENMVRSFIEMMQQAEIDGLITYAPTPAAPTGGK